jgi:hypothetical protein
MARPPLACVFRLSLAAVLVYLRRVSGMTAPMSLKAKRAGHRVHGGDVPMRQRPGDTGRRLPGRDEGLAFQCGLNRVHYAVGQLRQVRQRLVPDFRAVTVGAAQQPRLILALAPCLSVCRLLILTTCIAVGQARHPYSEVP